MGKSVAARQALTFVLACAGTALFWALALPLPFLFGPMAACLIAALLGLPLMKFGWVSVAARTILGVAVGASITPAVLGQVPGMAISASLVPIYLIVIAAVGVPFFRRVYGFDFPTAWYASMPGGLQDMVLFGIEAGGDGRALALIHATRVFLIVTVAPIILTAGFGASLDQPIGTPASDIPASELVLMVIAAAVGWAVAARVGLFGAPILGPMIVSGAMAVAGLIHVRPPSEAILTAQFLIGVGIGVGYVGVTLAELRRDVAAGVVFVLILAALAAVFTEIVVIFGLAPPLEGFLAFAPGGQAEMLVLAIIVGADLGYVVVHHLLRVVFVITGAPLAARIFDPARRR